MEAGGDSFTCESRRQLELESPPIAGNISERSRREKTSVTLPPVRANIILM